VRPVAPVRRRPDHRARTDALRDHSEIALREFGADLQVRNKIITLNGPRHSRARTSCPQRSVFRRIFSGRRPACSGLSSDDPERGTESTRSALLDFLLSIGAPVKVLKIESANGELIGDIEVRHAPVRGGVIEKELTAALIDEIPVLAVLGAASENGLVIRDAQELRIKETDRIATVADNFHRMALS